MSARPHATLLLATCLVACSTLPEHARRLSAKLAAVRLPTSSPPDAAAELQRRYDAMLEATTEDLLRDSTAFDEDTSGRHEPARQARWRARVEAELTTTPALRRDP